MPAPASACQREPEFFFWIAFFAAFGKSRVGHCEARPRVLEDFRTVTPENFALGTVQTSKGVPHETIANRLAAGTLRPAVAGRHPALKKGWPRIRSI